jgi:replicative DNA helicase
MERLLKITDELETNLLSGLLLDPSELPKVSEIVRPEDLSPQAAMVYGAMQEIAASDTRQLDKLTLYSKLEKSGGLDAAGGAEYLDYIGLFTPASPNLAYYALVIRDKALRRRIKEVGKAVAGLAEVWHGKAEELLDEAEKRLGELRGERRASSWITAKQTMLAAVKRLEELYAKGATISGIATGLRDLDLALGGLHAGELIILAARPAMGKTALALQIAKHVAKEKHGVGIFSLEMTHDELTPRMLANEARIDGQAMRSGRLSETHWSKLTMAIDVLLNTGLHIDDTLITSVFDMRTKARTLEQKLRNGSTPLGLLVVDYLQLAGQFGDGREQEIAAISRGLKALAKELRLPVLALSQLNRECEKQNRKPRLSDLRDSGAVEQDADVVLFIHRENVEDTKAEIIIGKQRNGPVGDVPVTFLKEIMSFENYSGRME